MYIPKKVTITKEKEAERKKKYERDHQMVKGRFSFKEVPGGTLCFSFFKYKGDPILRYQLKDGEVYTLPYMVAKHLATNVYENIYQDQLDQEGKHIHVATSKKHRTNFERLDFDDDNFIPSNIVTVEKQIIV